MCFTKVEFDGQRYIQQVLAMIPHRHNYDETLQRSASLDLGTHSHHTGISTNGPPLNYFFVCISLSLSSSKIRRAGYSFVVAFSEAASKITCFFIL